MATFTLPPPTIPLVKKISVLVVDDDYTSLAIVSGMLKQLDYQVTTAHSPYIALSTLRARRDFDLVVTDLHMPSMNGFQLKQHIDAEFKLPVVIMSADDKESVILESFSRGVVLYIVKPVNPEDLKNIWQYVNVNENENDKGKSPVVVEFEHFDQGESVLLDSNIVSTDSDPFQTSSGSATSASSSANNNDNDDDDDDGENQTNKRKYSRKGKEVIEDDQNNWVLPAPRRRRLMWSFLMHLQFLEAITYIGFDRAVPRRILEVMNVPGLTRENVASHLQKYRNFLKKISESETLTEREQRSRFATAHALMLQQQQYLFFLQQHNQMRGITNPVDNRLDLYNNVGFGSNGNFAIQPEFAQSSAAFGNGDDGLYQPFQFSGATNESSEANGYVYGNENGRNVAPDEQMFGNETEFNSDNFVNNSWILNSASNFQTQPPQNQTQGGDMVINNTTDGNNVEYHPLMDNHNVDQTQNIGEILNNYEVNNNNNVYPPNNAPENQVWDNHFMDNWFGFDP